MPLLSGWPTDAGAGSVSTEARWRAMARLWAPSGAVAGYLGALAPSYAGGTSPSKRAAPGSTATTANNCHRRRWRSPPPDSS